MEPLEANRACLSVEGSGTSTVSLLLALFEHHQPGHSCRFVINGVKKGCYFHPILGVIPLPDQQGK